MAIVAVTLVNGRLFELLSNGQLYGYDAVTGRVFTRDNFDPKRWNLCWQGYTPSESVKDFENLKLRMKEYPHELAVDTTNNLIFAVYPQYDAVCWYSAKDGRLADTAKGISKKAYLWVDRNDDGKATDDDVDWKAGHQLGGGIDPETLTLYTTPEPTDFNPVHRYIRSKMTLGGFSQLPGASEAAHRRPQGLPNRKSHPILAGKSFLERSPGLTAPPWFATYPLLRQNTTVNGEEVPTGGCPNCHTIAWV